MIICITWRDVEGKISYANMLQEIVPWADILKIKCPHKFLKKGQYDIIFENAIKQVDENITTILPFWILCELVFCEKYRVYPYSYTNEEKLALYNKYKEKYHIDFRILIDENNTISNTYSKDEIIELNKQFKELKTLLNI
jgi:hypothetical protein